MISVGVDIVELSRFKKANNIDRLAFFFLSPNEIEMASKSKDKYQHLASRFSVKEAVIKAIPEENVGYLDFEVIKYGNKPIVKFNNDKFNKYEVAISLSHTESCAIGFAAVSY